MDRLFLGFQLKLLLSLLVAGFLATRLILPGFDRRMTRNVEDGLAVPLQFMADTLAAEQVRTPGPSRILAELKVPSSASATLVNRQDLRLPAALLAQLDRGQIVSEPGRLRNAVVYIRVGKTDQALRLGPLNPILPMGQGRGLQFLLLALCGLSLGVYMLVRPLRRRLMALSRAADALGRGELGTRAVDDSRDVLGTVAAAFNRMAHEIQVLIAAQRELLRMVSHELRTPLQRIHFAIEKIRSAENPTQRTDGLARVERDLGELDALIEELLTYVRLQHDAPVQRDAVDLHELIESVAATQAELSETVVVETRVVEEMPEVQVNARLLRRALGNLIENGLRNARSRVEVGISRVGQQLYLDVEDDGPGVPVADRMRIFEPFMRVEGQPQRSSTGCGLGLAIVRRIAEHHQGTIRVDESPLGGARFRLALPA